MRNYWLIAGTATLSLLAGCGAKSDGPIRREPGNWSRTIEIVRFEGKGATPQGKAEMQGLLDATAVTSSCLTADAAAKEDILKNAQGSNVAGQNCAFDKPSYAGEHVALSGSCAVGTGKLRLSIKGISGATTQDLLMTTEQLDAKGAPEGAMEMRMRSRRNGDCKPGDITPRP
ncbi:hypothetical protein BH10PSE14_BH10PSE14_44270 [soil metagenome]